MRRRTPGLIAAVVATVMLGGGWALAQDQGVDVRDNSFAPATVTVTAGDTVTWTQSGSNPHSVTADDGSFDSHENCPPACMGEGDTFSETFNTPGEFGYFCKIHGSEGGQGMAGTVVVQTVEQEPDTSDDPPSDEEPAESDTDAGTAAGESGGAGTAPEGEPLAETGPPAGIIPLGLVLLAGAAVTFRRLRVRAD